MTRNAEIRKEILLQLYGARLVWHSAALITRQARKQGLDYTEAEVRAECEFLADQGIAQSSTDQVSGETKFKISSKGVIEYEKNQ